MMPRLGQLGQAPSAGNSLIVAQMHAGQTAFTPNRDLTIGFETKLTSSHHIFVTRHGSFALTT